MRSFALTALGVAARFSVDRRPAMPVRRVPMMIAAVLVAAALTGSALADHQAVTNVAGAPLFTSPAGATMYIGLFGSIHITATGTPTPVISMTAPVLPVSVSFDPGTGILSWGPQTVPPPTGTYYITFTASNGLLPVGKQIFALHVNKQPQTLTFTPLPDIVYGGPPIHVQVQSSSGLTNFRYFEDNNPSHVCSFLSQTSNELTITGAGRCKIRVDEQGDDTYEETFDKTSFYVYPKVNYTGPTATGTGNARVALLGSATCTINAVQFVKARPAKAPLPTKLPGGYSFPHGLMDSRLIGCQHSGQIAVTIFYPTDLPPNTQFWRWGGTTDNRLAHWYQVPVTIHGNALTFNGADGSPDDSDRVANGVYTLTGGAAVPLQRRHAVEP